MRDLVGYSSSWALVLVFMGILINPSAGLNAQEKLVDEARQQELQYLLKHDCGSCHGMRLKGGLGPALMPESLAGKPRQYLKQVISQGMPDSAMPPWEKLLSEADIDYLVFLLTPKIEPETESEVDE